MYDPVHEVGPSCGVNLCTRENRGVQVDAELDLERGGEDAIGLIQRVQGGEGKCDMRLCLTRVRL